MANIGTINVRFYAHADKKLTKEDTEDIFDSVDVLRLLLGGDFSNYFSYNVPIYMNPGGLSYIFDVQYGARWSGTGGVDAVVEKYGHLFDRTWVRYADDGQDDDCIFACDDEKSRKFCYGIDRIKIYAPEPLDENWQVDGDGYTLAIRGSYQTLNSRDILGDRMCPISTMTTPTSDERNLINLLPADFAKVYETLPKDRYRIEYFWQDRIVRASFPGQPEFSDKKWVEYSLDYWDNCVDPEYVEYHDRIMSVWGFRR